MNKTLDLKDSVTAEPIQDQIMRQLESVQTPKITLKDLTKAVAQVQEENGIQMTPAQTNSMVKSIFNQIDDSRSLALSRSQVRQTLDSQLE